MQPKRSPTDSNRYPRQLDAHTRPSKPGFPFLGVVCGFLGTHQTVRLMRYLKSVRCKLLILGQPFFVGLISNDAFHWSGVHCVVSSSAGRNLI